MNAEEGLISKDEIRQVIFEGEIIEDYREDRKNNEVKKFLKGKN